MRREFPAKVKEGAYARCNEHCEECSRPLATGDIFYDHVIADGLGGEPTLANCAVLCRGCHNIKTRTKDVPLIAKGKRVQLRDRGIRAKSTFGRRPTKEKSTSRYDALRAMREKQYARGRR